MISSAEEARMKSNWIFAGKKCNQPEDAGSDEEETQVDLNKPERGHEPVQEAPQTCPCE